VIRGVHAQAGAHTREGLQSGANFSYTPQALQAKQRAHIASIASSPEPSAVAFTLCYVGATARIPGVGESSLLPVGRRTVGARARQLRTALRAGRRAGRRSGARDEVGPDEGAIPFDANMLAMPPGVGL
jgi:hypothetical protein